MTATNWSPGEVLLARFNACRQNLANIDYVSQVCIGIIVY